MPKVSVIIPTYNRAKYLPEAINSALSQSYQNFEIIIIDDGSIDNTKKIIEKHITMHPDKIRYFYQENKGEAAARNRGVREAKGEYIAFLDSDDLWLRGKLEIQVQELNNNPNFALSYCYAKRIDKMGNLLDIKPTSPARNAMDFLDGKRVSMTVLLRKKCLNDIGSFDETIKVGTDIDMWLRIALKYKISFVNKSLAIMRTHDDNISNNLEDYYYGHVKTLQKLFNGEIENNFNRCFLKNLIARNYYLLSRICFNRNNAILAFKYSLMAIKINLLIGKHFIQKDDNFLSKIKKNINPYGLLCCCYIKMYLSRRIQNSKKTKVLYYEPSSGFGGSGYNLANFVNNLDRNKFKPIIAIKNEGPQFKKVHNAEFIKLKNYKDLESLSNVKSYLNLSINILLESLKLYLFIKIKKISLVHINTNIISGIPATIASKIAGIPCICHIRQTRRLIKREKLFVPWVNQFILMNKKAHDVYVQDIPKEKLIAIHDGLDLNEFCRFKKANFKEEFNLSGSPIIGFIGRIVKGKGQREFILAAERVLGKIPNAKFIIVGDAKGDDDNYYYEVKQLVESKRLSENVIFTGWRNDIQNIISNFDMLIQGTTTFAEGFGLTIIEAMALSKPVIATDIPGPSDIVVHGKTGFLVTPGRIQEMAEKIIYLLNNPEIARKMGENGRKRIEDNFNIEKTARDTECIYNEVLNIKKYRKLNAIRKRALCNIQKLFDVSLRPLQLINMNRHISKKDFITVKDLAVLKEGSYVILDDFINDKYICEQIKNKTQSNYDYLLGDIDHENRVLSYCGQIPFFENIIKSQFLKRARYNLQIVSVKIRDQYIVAIKKDFKNDKISFIKETHILNALSSHNIPSILKIDIKNNIIHTTLIPGISLYEVLKNNGAKMQEEEFMALIKKRNMSYAEMRKFKFAEGKKIISQVINKSFLTKLYVELEKIHSKDIILEDVKYGNIIVGKNNEPYFIDFHSAKILNLSGRTRSQRMRHEEIKAFNDLFNNEFEKNIKALSC